MKLAAGRGRALSALLALSVAACGKSGGEQPTRASASISSSALVSAVPSLSASAVPVPASPPPDAICRALRVEGEAKSGETVLATGAVVDGSEWVSLASGASLTLKHSSSGREVSLTGPALFRACGRGREQVLLARGKVTAGSGMGARPGAEVLVATPVAAVRYADADFTLNLDDKRLKVEVRAGQVELDLPSAPAAGAPPKGFKSPLRGKDKLTIPLGKPLSAGLMAQCQQAAESAEARARRVGDRSAPEPLGERAQVHVRARKAARAACTIAAAATGLVADPTERAGLWAEAARWEGLWESIPRPSRAQAGEK